MSKISYSVRRTVSKKFNAKELAKEFWKSLEEYVKDMKKSDPTDTYPMIKHIQGRWEDSGLHCIYEDLEITDEQHDEVDKEFWIIFNEKYDDASPTGMK